MGELENLLDREAGVLRRVNILDLSRLDRPFLASNERLHEVAVDCLEARQVVPSIDGQQAK